MKPKLKFLLLFFAIINLLIGLLSGLGRLGWSVPFPETFAHHGAIMVGGFLGTLISLEKVIPLKKPILFIGPLLSACSLPAFYLGHFKLAMIFLIAASIFFVLVYMLYLLNNYNVYLVLAVTGAVCWGIGNVLLLSEKFYPSAFPWWMGFLLFTIVSERLELSKFLPVSKRQKYFLIAFLILFITGVLLPFHGIGIYLSGMALVFTGIWLMLFDVVKLTIKKEGLVRFTAIALLVGYIFLIITGVFLIGMPDAILGYDIMVHTFFIGFVFAMIFAHGPIILPGVLGLIVKPYHPLFYLPLTALFLSLFMRITANVMLIPFSWRAISGWITAGSILIYFMLMITFTWLALRKSN
jgi:hypothetical protein